MAPIFGFSKFCRFIVERKIIMQCVVIKRVRLTWIKVFRAIIWFGKICIEETVWNVEKNVCATENTI